MLVITFIKFIMLQDAGLYHIHKCFHTLFKYYSISEINVTIHVFYINIQIYISYYFDSATE